MVFRWKFNSDANLQYYVPETSGNYSVQLTSNNGRTAVSEDLAWLGSLETVASPY